MSQAPRPLRLAMGQLRVEGGALDDNLRRAAAMVADAAAQGCRLIVLPECLDVGWTFPDTAALARAIPGPSTQVLADAAKAAGIWVCAGLAERAGDVVFNAVVVLSPAGDIVLHNRKINVLTIAQHIYATGDRMQVARTALGTLGANVCADNLLHSSALGHAYGRMGAELLLSPSAWAGPPDFSGTVNPCQDWIAVYTELAKLYGTVVVGVSNVGWIAGGAWDGLMCIGGSLAVGPEGLLAEGPYGADAEAVVVVDAELHAPPDTGTDLAERVAEALRRRGAAPGLAAKDD